MRTIYLIRHGGPELPAGERICLSRTDVPLSAEGRRQGELLADYFSGIALEGVYSSDMLRTKETAAYLSPQAGAVSGLQELGVGCWEGLTFREIRDQYPELYALRGEDPAKHIMPGGERPADCQARALAALQRLLDGTTGDIAIVAHAGVNRLLLSGFLGLELKEFLTIPQPYGCVNILREDGGTLTVEAVGLLPEVT